MEQMKTEVREGGDMAKTFNVSGACDPDIHYMVDIRGRLEEIRAMVDAGMYFMINRARQYGKTTTLNALNEFLKHDYMVISLDFQMISASKYRNENVFSLAFANFFLRVLEVGQEITVEYPAVNALKRAVENRKEEIELYELFTYLSRICGESKKPVILMIDEVDSASDNQVFMDFLAQLRGYYIARKRTPTFHSVILAGVYDIKNIRHKIRQEEEHKRNSPWNIAADFLVDMSFSAEDIAGMLGEYEADYGTGMDVESVAGLIYDYTSGYPFLVSRICMLIDERITGGREFPNKHSAWTKGGLLAAVRLLTAEKNTLFESLTGKLASYTGLRNLIYSLLFSGNTIPYQPLNTAIETAEMFGLIRREGSNAVIANRIFEIILYDLFLSEEILDNAMYKSALQDQYGFVRNGHLDMKLILERFVIHFDELYGDRDEKFLEDVGRRYFLLYLKPIINGTGNYYIESRTRNRERTDVIVDYRGEQFVIELKLWRGSAYNKRGETQLCEYLDYYHLKRGYMLSFNFNKKKEIGVKELRFGDKVLVEAVV